MDDHMARPSNPRPRQPPLTLLLRHNPVSAEVSQTLDTVKIDSRIFIAKNEGEHKVAAHSHRYFLYRARMKNEASCWIPYTRS